MAEVESVRVRPLAASDHDAWLPLWRGYQQFYEMDIPAEVSAVTWRRLLDANEPMAGALAVVRLYVRVAERSGFVQYRKLLKC